MKLYVLLIYLVHCVYGEAVTSIGMIDDGTSKTCTMERVDKMIGYVCSNLNFKEIPQHLRTGLEVSEIVSHCRIGHFRNMKYMTDLCKEFSLTSTLDTVI